MRSYVAAMAVSMALLFVATSRGQVPEVQGTCVSNCGGSSSGSGGSGNPYAARSAARLARQRNEFDKTKHQDDQALKKSGDLFHKGKDEEAKGDPCKASADFQKSLSLVQSTDVSTPEGIYDSHLIGQYLNLQARRQHNVEVTSKHATESQAQCAQQQARNTQPSAAAFANDRQQQPPASFRVESTGNGVNSCYRADPSKTSCLELRNNSERRVRLWVDGLPGVQCTVEPHSFCSLPMGIGHLRLSMLADDEKGTGPTIGADIDLTNAGTRVNLDAAN